MQLDLTNDQAFELWTTLTLRVEQLRKDRELHPDFTIIGAITRRQLARTKPIFEAVNAHVTATA